MEVTSVGQISEAPKESAVIAFQFQGESLEDDVAAAARQAAQSDFADAESRGELKGKLYNSIVLRGTPSILIVGLGKRKEFSNIRCRRAVEAGTRFLSRHGFRKVSVLLPRFLGSAADRIAVESVVRGTYDEGLLKTSNESDYTVDTVTLVGSTSLEAGRRGKIVGESVNFARDLVNLPPNDISPRTLAERLKAMADETGLGIRVLDETEVADLGMGALLAVGKGSSEPAMVIDLQYGPETAPTKLALVGKGLTFDSGGLSIKTGPGMEWMKGDMAGGAAVAGAMRAISLLKPEGIHVRGIIGAVENMIGPSSMKPGDVLRTMSGKTIEVLNTDAEGRLVLADVLNYAVKRAGATHIVDVATLTGAVEVALGNEAAGLIGTSQEWIDRILAAADSALERLWQLPLYPEYRIQMDSDLADMKNTGGRAGGALTAASLLAEFVDGVPWAHMDIAGLAWVERANGYSAKGATGYAVATLTELALGMSSGSTDQA